MVRCLVLVHCGPAWGHSLFNALMWDTTLGYRALKHAMPPPWGFPLFINEKHGAISLDSSVLWNLYVEAIKVVGKVILSFTHYPLYKWYLHSKEFLLNLRQKFESNYSSCTRGSNENMCSSSGGAEEKGKRG